MRNFTRRSFVAAAAAGAASGRTLPAIGVQLYTVRTILPDQPLETLRAIEQIGFREVEAVGRDLEKIWAPLKETSLKAVSLHLDTGLFLRAQDKLPAALDDAVKRGFQYVVCPYIAPADRGGVEVIKRLAETLSRAGQRCRAAGLALAYHNHAFEFEPAGSKTLLDILLESTDPKLVGLELDIMWAKVAGVEPVAVLEKYKGRIPLMHVKNLRAGIEKRYNEQAPRDGFVEAGKGIINMKPVLAAAAHSGVKHYFVEQDQTPGNPLDSLRESFQYLKNLSY